MTKKTYVNEELFDAIEHAKNVFDSQHFKFSALASDNISDLEELYSVFRDYEVSTGHSFSRDDEELLIKYLLFDGEKPFVLKEPDKFILEAKDSDGDLYWFKKDIYGRSTFTDTRSRALEFESQYEAEKFKTGDYYIKQA